MTLAGPVNSLSKAHAGSIELSHLVAQLDLPADARILEIGSGGPGVQKILAPAVNAFTGPVFGIDLDAPRAEMIVAKPKERIDLRLGDPFNVELPPNIHLCTIVLATARGPDVLEELIYDRIHPILAEGGVVAIQICRDVSSESLDALKITADRVREVLQSFSQNQFGTLTLENSAPLKLRFDACAYFEFMGWAPRTKRAVNDDPIVWLVLRKRPQASKGQPAARGLPRTPRPDQFLQSELAVFLRELKASGLSFHDVAGFSSLYEAYYKWDPTGTTLPEIPFGLVKLDIHGNIRRPLEMAHMLRSVGIPGLFLMMPRHPMNEDYYNSESTWDSLREIRDLGHEIGLHPDLFYLIRTYGDIYTGLEAALDDMRKRGFAIRAATVHGDTRPHIKAQKMQANDFFVEEFRRTKWNGLPPVGEEYLVDHVRKYSHKKIAADFGLEYFSEVHFVHNGEMVTENNMLYLLDNRRTLELRNCPDTGDNFPCPTLFRVQKKWTREAIDILKQRPFLALFHPQWYW